MIRIGLLSDTHGYIHPGIYEFFKDCNEIWHAGDIGDIQTADTLSGFKKFTAVYGNIDGNDIRISYPQVQIFQAELVKVIMVHIGGYPGKYEPKIRKILVEERPQLFISGHSHILKVIYDEKHALLHINPGAAGKSGLHQVITFARFTIDGKNIRDLQIFEAPKH